MPSVVLVEEQSEKAERAAAPAPAVQAQPPAPAPAPATKRNPKALSSENVSPEATAWFVSRWTYSWVDPVFWHGWRKPLEMSDIWQLGPKWRVEYLTGRLEKAWADEVAAHPPKNAQGAAAAPDAAAAAADAKATGSGRGKKGKDKPEGPSLLRALWNLLFWELAPYGILRFLSDMASILSPYLIKYVVNFVTQSKLAVAFPAKYTMPWLSEGIMYALFMFGLQLITTLLQNAFFFLALSSGLALRAAFTGVIYRKSMRLSAAARQDFSSGKVTNVVSTDAARIEAFLGFCHTMWTAPVQIIVITGFLISQLGYAAIVGVALLVLLGPLQGRIWRLLTGIRKEAAPLTDKRVRQTQEVLQGIRVLKFFTWEKPFLEQIEDIRKREVALILKRSVITAFVMTVSFAVPVLSASLAFIIYGINNDLDPAHVFSSLTWFNQLRFPLMFLPQIIVGYAELKIAIERIQALLLAPELEAQPEIVPDAPNAVEIVDGEFNWDSMPPAKKEQPKGKKAKMWKRKEKTPSPPATPPPEKDGAAKETSATPAPPAKSTLRNINIAIPRGKLVAVVGSVGSGKSSLLNALVGEMKRVKGTVTFSSRLGYAPQQAWIQNASVKDNILFGQPFDEERYHAAIRDCSLEKDLEILADGDLTQIGERGINLSGGQKQRVNLARMVYFNADIVLLDDPLSAVDAHVGRALFDNCIQGALAGKTRILVTHQLHFLPRVDYVIVMSDGEVSEQGTFSELMAADGEFATLMRNYGGVEDAESEETSDVEEGNGADEKTKKNNDDLERIGKALAASGKKDVRELMQTEERATGTVDGKVWMSYFNAAGGVPFLVGLIFTLALVQGARVGTDYWLVVWTNQQIPSFNGAGPYIGVYWGWAVFQSIGTYCFGVYFAYHGTRAARVLHEGAIKRVVRAPVSFFDTTPLGRIINRFSKDQDGLDNTLMDSFRMFIQTLASTISVFILIGVAVPLFLAPLVPVLGLYYLIQSIYRSTSRELKRLDSISRSPLYASIGETLTGLPTIRAYREQERFISDNNKKVDGNNAPYFLVLAAQRWVSLRFEFLGAILVFCAAALGIFTRESNTLSVSFFGLALSYSLQVTQTLNWCIRQFTETEIAMNAVERVNHYASEIEVEAAEITDVRPPAGWPAKGEIEFKDVSMRYAPDLPLVLKSVSFSIRDKEKIGVVGRTGSGKSSLMQVLFRMVEPASGAIVVDGITTSELGLKDLRSGLGIIPQDPVLFSGTFRRNLDPFGEHTDAELWDALERANIKAKVAESEGGLDGEVHENGENLSVGQRQLVCLARAMLKKPRVLVMDEATANVDYETDAIIQKCLRQDFGDSTVLTIAHRLNTIVDYDRVMVLSAGEIVEFDTPQALVAKEGGVFRSMVDETGPQNVELIHKQLFGESSSSDGTM